MARNSLEIFLFVPNLIGYLRLLLIAVSWYYIEDYAIFLPLYIFSAILDGIDGWAARRLGQVSDYGATLDVVVDLIGRGMIWCYVNKYGYAVSAFEWLVYLGNTERANGKQWKESFDKAPAFVHWVMDKGFKTPLGTIAITGLHVLPIWLYAMRAEVLGAAGTLMDFITSSLTIARLICASVEAWCLWKYVVVLLHRSPHKDAK